MAYLLDTNVLARRLLTADPEHSSVKAAIDSLLLTGEAIYITAQNLVEFQAMATRPSSANGIGLSTAEASALVRNIELTYSLLPETPEIYREWRTLVERTDTRGRQVYDARLAAVMLVHGITHILTINAGHFRRFSEIVVVQPSDLASDE